MLTDTGLFRGKRKDTGEWIQGGFHYHQLIMQCPLLARGEIPQPPEMEAIIVQDGFADWNMYMPVEAIAVIPETVGQFIRLKDMDGKKAFTGDIAEDMQGRRWVIFECAGGFGVCRPEEWKHREYPLFMFEGLSDMQNSGWFKSTNRIVGNLFDTPELLEETRGV